MPKLSTKNIIYRWIVKSGYIRFTAPNIFCGYGKFSSFFELPREKTIISLKDKYFGSEFGVTHDDDVNESYITADNKGWDGTGPVAFSAKKFETKGGKNLEVFIMLKFVLLYKSLTSSRGDNDISTDFACEIADRFGQTSKNKRVLHGLQVTVLFLPDSYILIKLLNNNVKKW